MGYSLVRNPFGGDPLVRRDADGAFIPGDPLNRDRVAYDAWRAAGGEPSPPPQEPSPPPPEAVSDRQIFYALAIGGVISEAEALAAVQTGELPAKIAAVIDEMPGNQKFAARMLLSGATTFERHHPLTEALAAALGYSAEQMDDLFREAAAL